MKKFEPQTGGHRFRLDDLMLMQQAVIEALSGLVSALNPSQNCVISGVKASVITSSNTHSISGGFAAFQGEVFRVNAVDLAYDASKRLFLKVNEVILTPSPVLYQDSNTKTVHFDRTLVVKYFNAGDGDQDGVNGMYYDNTGMGVTVPPGVVVEYYMVQGETINDVFDTSGLGKNKLKGWAMCNGLNGTPDLRGLFTVMPSAGVFNPAPLVSNAISGIGVSQSQGTQNVSILQNNLPNYNLTVNEQPHTHKFNTAGDHDMTPASTFRVIESFSDNLGNPSFHNVDADMAGATTGLSVNSAGGNTPLKVVPPSVGMFKIMRIAY